MRVSCNGCRVLRKGCSEDCSIRPCLQWLKNPDSQANATVFLAKFYGRAGLMNLVNAGPDHLRPAIFRSLLYEACGGIVNPIYGSVGLLWSGNWQLCQAAVDAVLNGDPILQVSYSETAAAAAASNPVPPLHKAAILSSSYDIRHVSKDDIDVPATSAAAQVLCGSTRASAATFVDPAAHDLYKVNKASRNRFKRSSAICSSTGIVGGSASHEARPGFPRREPAPGCPRPSSPVRDNLHWRHCYGAAAETWQAPSHESSAGQASAGYSAGRAAVGTWCSTSTMLRDGDRRENESDMSMVTCSLQGADLGKAKGQTAEGRYVELELTLGLEPVHHSQSPHSSGGSNNVRSEDSRRRWGAIHHPTCAGLPYGCDRTTMDEYWAAVKTTTRVDLRLDLPA